MKGRRRPAWPRAFGHRVAKSFSAAALRTRSLASGSDVVWQGSPTAFCAGFYAFSRIHPFSTTLSEVLRVRQHPQERTTSPDSLGIAVPVNTGSRLPTFGEALPE